jgi:hypothetical protein
MLRGVRRHEAAKIALSGAIPSRDFDVSTLAGRYATTGLSGFPMRAEHSSAILQRQ